MMVRKAKNFLKWARTVEDIGAVQIHEQATREDRMHMELEESVELPSGEYVVVAGVVGQLVVAEVVVLSAVVVASKVDMICEVLKSSECELVYKFEGSGKANGEPNRIYSMSSEVETKIAPIDSFNVAADFIGLFTSTKLREEEECGLQLATKTVGKLRGHSSQALEK
ncbi:hypothetical protein C8Q75DRAFT_865737 [Abortiporus biennis]|nr:hypothetical protein C8Q75DRAFT_865737 [Abortiporus biennis]